MADQVLIHLQEVTKTYMMGEVAVEALKATTLDIFAGELIVILGPSGSGKSTLLNLIGGMDRVSSGALFFRQQALHQANNNQLTQYRRDNIGFVFQFYNLISDLTAWENVELAAGLVEDPLPTAEVLKQVGLEERLDHFPAQLSGGEQQRISIARAIVKKPLLLLCDEPTGALDYQTGKSILELLIEVNRVYSSTVVIVTHNAAIGAIADRVMRMSSGRIAEIEVNPTPATPEGIEW
ncbi:MAG: ABC transporter ATP-binding protein [Syntrophomonadaceae bacterium]|jgi:putative ABC transport system ATP-binding protein